jgi:hypothetical protein
MTYRIEFVSYYYNGREYIEREIIYQTHYENLGDAENMACEILDADKGTDFSVIMSIAILDDENDEVVVDAGSYFYKPLHWRNND